MFTSGSTGGVIGQMAEKLVPIGEEAGFKASRDLDRVVMGAYSFQGVDAVAVLVGRFDEQKIAQAAQNHTPMKNGGVLVATPYANRTIYTINNAGFAVLTSKTVLAGTETGIRRALDRVRDNQIVRNQDKWMLETVETPNSAFAVAADLATQPVTATLMSQIPSVVRNLLGWLNGLKAVRMIGNFHDPGLNIAGTLTYGDAQTAAAASDDVKRTGAAAKLFAMFGAPQLQNLDVKVAQSDVQVAFAVDDGQLRTFLASAQQYLPQ
jgi:hypothetical protein